MEGKAQDYSPKLSPEFKGGQGVKEAVKQAGSQAGMKLDLSSGQIPVGCLNSMT